MMKRTAWLLTACVGLLLMGCGQKDRLLEGDTSSIQEQTKSSGPAADLDAESSDTATETGQESAAAGTQKDEPEPVEAQVESYSVSDSLKEVTNLKSFTKAIPLPDAHRKLLAKNLFVCAPTDEKQLFFIYENNDYLNIPSFITTDTVLQLYHIFFDFTLRTVESETLMPVLERLTKGMLAESVSTWKHVAGKELKQAALKNVVYFGVAAKLLKLKVKIPSDAASMVQQELDLIDKHKGFAVGAIFPYKVDYSQFVPRGHYTRSPLLKRFFKAMMWYGLTPFALRYRDEHNELVRADEQIRQGLLLTRTLHRAKLTEDWETIYEPTAFYVGSADDHTPDEWKKPSDDVFGAEAKPNAFMDAQRFERFVAAVEDLREARIQARMSVFPELMPDPKIQLRFMGQRYIADSEILQRLSFPPPRMFPTGLDIMAVLGGESAKRILEKYADLYGINVPTYRPDRKKLIEDLAADDDKTWTSNLYWSWLHALRALLESVPEGYPSFMRNEAWADKSTHTALASWAELRHDTILYGKQSVAECGDGGPEKPFVKGYVEPNVVFYDRLLKLTEQSRDGLAIRKLLPDRLKDRFEQFVDLLSFLRRVSEKELRGDPLTRHEYLDIRYLGGKLEYLTLSVMEGRPNAWTLVSEADKDMAVIADVHTTPGEVLEEGVGRAYEILVVAPVEGKPTLTRGAAFSYYEFRHPIADRLTDEKWHEMLDSGKAPGPPPWTDVFLTPPREGGDETKVHHGYSPGC